MSKHKRVKLAGAAFLSMLLGVVVGTYYIQSQNAPSSQSSAQSGQIIVTEPPISGKSNLQLRTFKVISLTPSPTVPGSTGAPSPTSGSTPTTGPLPTSPGGLVTPAIGGPNPPSGYYCIDDHDPDMCDDNSSHLVPKGSGGVSASCGTIIEQAHKLAMALPQFMKGVRDSLTSTVSTSCASTGPYGDNQYFSTFFVIDAFNLAGFSELSKSNASHVSPSGLFTFFQSPPVGYEYIPYTTSVVQQFGAGQKDLTGCVMFLKVGSSYHIGIVNEFELFTSGGDGVISILQAGTSMYIDRFPVAGWSIRNTSTNQTSTDGVTGFGCHT